MVAGYIKKNEVGGTCGVHEGNKKYCKILVVKPPGRILLGSLLHRWNTDIK
jgi:hypothetical protein